MSQNSIEKIVKRSVLPAVRPERPAVPKQAFPYSHHRASVRGRAIAEAQLEGGGSPGSGR